MKNIETILKEAGLEVTEDQLKKISDAVKENYKTVNDWQKQVDKAESLQSSLDANTTLQIWRVVQQKQASGFCLDRMVG